MSKDLLEHYNSELNYFRRLSEEFAVSHPKIAGRLKLEKQAEDPHVSRLIEAFAFLNARLRMKLEDEFPELCQAFLNVLYPEYLNPIPSCGIVELKLPESQFGLKDGYQIPAHTEIMTAPVDGEPCRFRTAYPVHLWPISIADASVRTPPFIGPPTSAADLAKGVVRIELKTYSSELSFSDMPLGKIRFYLNGDSRYIYDLYELVLNNVSAIAVAPSDAETKPVILPADAISPVGFSVEDALLDYSPRSRLGFHLLTEFCTFPQKFLFFDIAIDQATLARVGGSQTLNLYLYLDAIPRNLENNIEASAFCLGAAPIVNLFKQRAESIQLDAAKSEYRVIPDARRALANEVYSIDRVIVDTEGQDRVVYPFYSANHPTGDPADNDGQLFWFPSRRNVQGSLPGKEIRQYPGTDVFIEIVGLEQSRQTQSVSTLDIYATCLNRNYPNELPRGAKLSLSGSDAMVKASLLMHPTETRRPDLGDEVHWRLISQLSLNHMTLTDDQSGATSLREMLRLFNFTGNRGVDMMIDGLLQSTARRMVGRVGGSVSAGFCKGTELTLLVDETKFSGGGEYLFGCVLERFLAMYTSINSFTRTIVETKQGKRFDKWPLRTGDQELI